MRLVYQRQLNARGMVPETESPSYDPTGGRSTHISPSHGVRIGLRASLPLTSQARSYYTRERPDAPSRGFGIGSAATFVGMTLGMKPPSYALTVTVPGPDGAPQTFEDSLHLTPDDLSVFANRPTAMYSVTECGNWLGCFGMEMCGAVPEAVILEDPVVPWDAEQRPDEARPPLDGKHNRQAYQRAGQVRWTAAECVNNYIEDKVTRFDSRDAYIQWREEQKHQLLDTTFVLPMQKLAEEETRKHGFFIFDFGDDTWKSPAQYCHRTDNEFPHAAQLTALCNERATPAAVRAAALRRGANSESESESEAEAEAEADETRCPSVKSGFWCGLPYTGLRKHLTPQQRSGLLRYYLRLGRAPLPIQFWSPGDWLTFMRNNHDALAKLGGDCIPTAELQRIMRSLHWDNQHTAQLPAVGAMAAIAQDLWAQRICRGMPYELMPLADRVWGMPPWVMPSKLWPVYARAGYEWLRPTSLNGPFGKRHTIGCLPPLPVTSQSKTIVLDELMSDHPLAYTDGELFCAIYPTSFVTSVLPPYSAGSLEALPRSNDLPFVTFDVPTSTRIIRADDTHSDIREPDAFGGDIGTLPHFHGPHADRCHQKSARMKLDQWPDGLPTDKNPFGIIEQVLGHNTQTLCEADYDRRDIFHAGQWAVPFYNGVATAAFLHSLVTIDPPLAAAATFLAGRNGTQTLRDFCAETATHRGASILMGRKQVVERTAQALEINHFVMLQIIDNARATDAARFPKYDRVGRKLCKIKALSAHLRGYTSTHFLDSVIFHLYAAQGRLPSELYERFKTNAKATERLAAQRMSAPLVSIIENHNYVYPLYEVLGVTHARNEIVKSFKREPIGEQTSYHDTIVFEKTRLTHKRKRDNSDNSDNSDLALEQARATIAMQATKLNYAQEFLNKVNDELKCVITQEMPGQSKTNPKLLRFLSTLRTTSPEQYERVDLKRDLAQPTLQIGGVIDHTDQPDQKTTAETYLAQFQHTDDAQDPVTRTTLMPGAQLIEDKLLKNINDATQDLLHKLGQTDDKDKPLNKLLL